jgi:hypothetical protein
MPERFSDKGTAMSKPKRDFAEGGGNRAWRTGLTPQAQGIPRAESQD